MNDEQFCSVAIRIVDEHREITNRMIVRSNVSEVTMKLHTIDSTKCNIPDMRR